MPTTTNGAPYPSPSDPNNIPGDLQAIAEWADSALGTQAAINDSVVAAAINDPDTATAGALLASIADAIASGEGLVEAVETILTGPGAGPKVGNELVTSVDHVNLHGVVINADLAATVACRVESFLTRFDTALAGRQVEFYIGSMVGATFTPTYASGLVDAPETGVLSWTATQGSHPDMAVGDVLGVWCSATTQADSVRAAVSGGNPIGDVYWDVTPADRLAVGTPKSTWDGSPHLTVYVASLAATMVTGGLRIVTSDNIDQYTDGGYWAGKKITAVGTSITVGADADMVGGKFYGYVNQLADRLGAVVDNQGVGSSGVVWDGTRALSLGATRAELTAAGFDPNESYETRLIGHAADLVILDHGFNDRDRTIGSIDDTTPATFYGAFNRVIGALLAERPTQQFVFLTPVSIYNPANETGSGPQAGTVATRTAILALADKYKAPVLDLAQLLNISQANKNSAFTDGIHPTQAMHDRIARILAAFIKTL